MNLHTCPFEPRGRTLLVYRMLVQGLRVEAVAHATGLSVRTAYKWLKRFRQRRRRLGPDCERTPDRASALGR